MPDSYATIEQRLSGRSRYVSDDAVLRLTVYNAAAGVTVTLSGRRLDCEGRVVPFSHRLVPTTDRVATTVDVPLTEGWLLGIQAAITVGAPREGQTYATLSLGRGRGTTYTELETFASGTITAAHRLGWPGALVGSPLEGPGAIRVITATVPAAGADWSETVPTGAVWELVACRASFVAAAAVATRQPFMLLDDGVNALYYLSGHGGATANSTTLYQWAQGVPFTGLLAGAPAPIAVPTRVRLSAGSRVRVSTINVQAADQWSAIVLLVNEWIAGA